MADIGFGAGLGLAAVGAVLLIVGEVQKQDEPTQTTSFFPGFRF